MLPAFFSWILSLSRAASACPVCFGKTSDNAGLFAGLTWGLFILLGCTFLIIAKLAAVVMNVEKARALAEAGKP